jgi:hypothetical protein
MSTLQSLSSFVAAPQSGIGMSVVAAPAASAAAQSSHEAITVSASAALAQSSSAAASVAAQPSGDLKRRLAKLGATVIVNGLAVTASALGHKEIAAIAPVVEEGCHHATDTICNSVEKHC